MKPRSAVVLGLILSVTMVFSLIGCSQTTNGTDPNGSAPPETRDTLYVVLSSDPAHLDPNDMASRVHYQATRQIYETLFIYDENYEIIPWLCESYEYENDETIILHLRKDVKFHNGDDFKASDVLFTFKRILDNQLNASKNISKILLDQCVALDDHTLKIVTDGPVATQIANLEHPSTAILSERAYVEANGDWLKGACVGTGPYKLVSFSPGDQLELEAHENYWRSGEPSIKKVVMRVVSDSTSRAIEAEIGGADLVYEIPPKDVSRIQAAEGVELLSEPGTNTSYLLFNTALAPLDNPLIRQAIWYAVDAKAAVNIAYGDVGTFAEGWVCPGIKGFDPTQADVYFPTRDVDKAKSLLAEAGYADGVSVRIAVPNNDQGRCDMTEAFQAQLGEAGIDLGIDIMENSTWNAHIMAGKHHLTIFGMSAPDFESDFALAQYMPGTASYNMCGYDNPEFQAKVSEASITLDNETRYQLYREAQNMLLGDFVTLPLWHKDLNAAVKDGVKGFRLTRSYDHHYLQTVYFED